MAVFRADVQIEALPPSGAAAMIGSPHYADREAAAGGSTPTMSTPASIEPVH